MANPRRENDRKIKGLARLRVMRKISGVIRCADPCRTVPGNSTGV